MQVKVTLGYHVKCHFVDQTLNTLIVKIICKLGNAESNITSISGSSRVHIILLLMIIQPSN